MSDQQYLQSGVYFYKIWQQKYAGLVFSLDFLSRNQRTGTFVFAVIYFARYTRLSFDPKYTLLVLLNL